MVKIGKPPKKKTVKTSQTRHLQCRLNPSASDRERDALAIYDAAQRQGWTTRDIFTHALLAWGESVDSGYQAPPTEVRLRGDTLTALTALTELANRMAQFDFSGAVNRVDSGYTGQHLQRDAQATIDAIGIFNNGTWDDDDEDDF